MYYAIQKRTWEENDTLKYHISDEISGNFFSLEEAESLRRTPRDRPKLAESVRHWT